MYVCVRVRVCVWGRRSWEEREKKEIRTRKEREEKRKNKETGEKRKHKLIHTDRQRDRQTDGQTDGRTDRHKSNDMRYKTEQYTKSNSIESYSIKLNQFRNKVE